MGDVEVQVESGGVITLRPGSKLRLGRAEAIDVDGPGGPARTGLPEIRWRKIDPNDMPHFENLFINQVL